MSTDEPNPYQSPAVDRFSIDAESDPAWNEATMAAIKASVMISRVILFALCMGLTTFTVVILLQPSQVVAPGGGPAVPNAVVPSRVLMVIAAAISLGGLAIGLVLDWTSVGLSRIPGEPSSGPAADPRVAKAVQKIQSISIFSWALREGPAFLCLILFQQTKSIMFLIPAFLLLLTMLLSFPMMKRTCRRIQSMLSRA